MITREMAKEFAKDYLTTLNSNGKKNTFRSAREIANLMNISIEKAIRFIVVSKANGFMCDDNRPMPNYMNFPTLFKVWEKNLM